MGGFSASQLWEEDEITHIGIQHAERERKWW